MAKGKRKRQIRSKHDPDFVPKAKTDLAALRPHLVAWLDKAARKGQTVYLGVDPGLDGGMSLLTETSSFSIAIPVVEVPRQRSAYEMAKLRAAARKRAKKKGEEVKETAWVGKAREYDDETILDVLDEVFGRSVAVCVTVEQCEPIVGLSFKKKGAFAAKQSEGGEGSADSGGGSTPKVNRDLGVATGMWPLAVKSTGRRFPGKLKRFLWPESLRWKTTLGVGRSSPLPGKTLKEKSLALVRIMWPNTKIGDRKGDHNIAESRLISHYGRLLDQAASSPEAEAVHNYGSS